VQTTFESPNERVLRWIRGQELPTGGIRVHSEDERAYPEVAGYLVPTLLQYRDMGLALRLIKWLLSIQRADGSYTSPDGIPYVFDTGQVLRGLLAATERVSGAMQACELAAGYLYSQMVKEGRGGFGERYANGKQGLIQEGIHLYVLAPLKRAAKILRKPEYEIAAEECLQYYLRQRDSLQVSNLTHFLGYELEALIELDLSDLAKPILEKLRERQRPDGSLPGKEGVSWVCVPGLAQLAVCWYKIEEQDPADRAMEWLEAHQQATGGFLGSLGKGAGYFPNTEIPWAAKFYLDAYHLKGFATT